MAKTWTYNKEEGNYSDEEGNIYIIRAGRPIKISSVKKEELKNRALRTKNSKIIYSLKCRFFVIIPFFRIIFTRHFSTLPSKQYSLLYYLSI